MAKINYWGIMPAAGIGSRMQAGKPKQYIEIEGKAMLLHSLESLLNLSQISGVQLCLSSNDQYWSKLAFQHPLLLTPTIGGAMRADSVLAGLNALESYAKPEDWVLVHDAARPFLEQAALVSLVEELANHPVGGILAIPAADTLKQCDSQGNIITTISRENVWRAQTPQMFRYQILKDSLEQALQNNVEVSDESSAIEAAGLKPKVIIGNSKNRKVTYKGDEVI